MNEEQRAEVTRVVALSNVKGSTGKTSVPNLLGTVMALREVVDAPAARVQELVKQFDEFEWAGPEIMDLPPSDPCRELRGLPGIVQVESYTRIEPQERPDLG